MESNNGENLQSQERTLRKDIAAKVIFGSEELFKKYYRRLNIFMQELFRGEKLTKIEFDFEDAVKEDLFFKDSSLGNGEQAAGKQPNYQPSFDEPLGFHKEEAKEEKMQGFTCFNCLGDHHLKDCKEQHDGARIANNKSELMESQTIRYHTEDGQSFEGSSMRPGFISDKLREALDLKKTQLPLYIYNMRILGYPPGWMKEAEIQSGLAIYDSAESVPKRNALESNEKEKSRYDGNKFISFPGFNTPLPFGMSDEFRALNMPPLQLHQQLSEALKHEMVTLSPQGKKRKNTETSDEGSKKDKIDERANTPSKANPNSRQQQNSSNACKTPVRTPKPVVTGSPLIDNGNPYKKLPNIDNFSVGISEYLPYENLPDAVGSYDKKLKGVLTSVRRKMSLGLNDSKQST